MDSSIVRAAIHPGIGIARVGNSPEDFIGPELPYPVKSPDGGYKDAAGALKRQAARFRIYGYNARGQVVRELTADDATIVWAVHVANKKAAWYNFELALDLPTATPVPLRNAGFVGERRRALVIDPGPRSIQGRLQSGPEYYFDTGTFCGQPVYLGELRTDEHGRLLFLGGRGKSGTIYPHNTPTTYANNNGWYDDIADGPVSAEVTLDGRSIPVDPAWVVVAPPNYAPDQIAIQTMYDVLYDTYQLNWFTPATRPSFTRLIEPMLRRFCDMQWVNYGFYVQFGWDAPYNFLRPSYFAQLACNQPEFAEVRRQVFNMFRDPAATSFDAEGWPQVYGDDLPGDRPGSRLSLTKTQYTYLNLWAEGHFAADWNPAEVPPRRIEDVPLAEQPRTLDKAALTFCIGGPFHPGCEMTWPMRHVTMYYAPFRIRPRAPGQPEPDYGAMLDPAIINDDNENSPLCANGPGDITRWMAVPWQTDSASCQAGYEPEFDPFLPTFWPARVPNHVLSDAEYHRVIDPNLPLEERLRAFHTRATWIRGLHGQYLDWINQMVTDFSRLGIVEPRDGPADDLFPPVMYVESKPDFPPAPHDRHRAIGHVEKITRQQRRAADRAGDWRAVAEAAEAAVRVRRQRKGAR